MPLITTNVVSVKPPSQISPPSPPPPIITRLPQKCMKTIRHSNCQSRNSIRVYTYLSLKFQPGNEKSEYWTESLGPVPPTITDSDCCEITECLEHDLYPL